MNTPAHLLLGLAVFGRRGDRAVTTGAAIGAVLPDASLYVLAGVSLSLLNIPPSVVFNELYFSQSWQTVFAIDNSVFVWLTVLGIAYWRSWWPVCAAAGAALLHIALDFPLHAGDGRPHFWPLSGWVFDSPVSYWDSTHHAGFVVPVMLLLAVAASFVVWRRWNSWAMRGLAIVLLGAEVWVARQWLLFF